MKLNEYLMDLILAQLVMVCVQCQTYEETLVLFQDKVNPEKYRREVRPLRNQSEILDVYVVFSLLSIVGIDDIAQSFTCNGFFAFAWIDEIIAWDPKAYSGQTVIHPDPEDIWRPRVILLNTLDKRDIFGDDMAPLIVKHNGLVTWIPANVFSSSCELNMDNYPFDQHACTIQMKAMTFTCSEMRFHAMPSGNVTTDSYTGNGEWDLKSVDIFIPTNLTKEEFPEVYITFQVRRRPFYLLLNVILPAIFLSFLNIMVFVIPADSGEKISYGITVLLALSVFLSTVAGMLPRSSNVPMVTIYLFILLIISMLTVINSIIIVYLHHKEEKEEQHQKARTYFTRAFNKITQLRQAVSPMSGTAKDTVHQIAEGGPDKGVDNHDSGSHKPDGPRVNRYKVIGKHIDLVSFVVFLVTWLSVTISVMVKISA